MGVKGENVIIVIYLVGPASGRCLMSCAVIM